MADNFAKHKIQEIRVLNEMEIKNPVLICSAFHDFFPAFIKFSMLCCFFSTNRTYYVSKYEAIFFIFSVLG